MDPNRLSLVGAAAAALLALVVLLPSVVVDAPGVADYYASGPVGLTAVGFVAVVGVVVFLSVRREHSDTATVAGVAVALAVVGVALAVLWALSVDPTVLYSFPPEYAWLERHRWAVVAASLLVAAVASLLARATVRV